MNGILLLANAPRGTHHRARMAVGAIRGRGGAGIDGVFSLLK